MSYIDSFDHELIGYLGYLPIYRPLEVISGEEWGGYDFSATPDNLILGGGSGEHPALVIHRPPSLVSRFLYDQLTDDEAQSLSQTERDYLHGWYYAGNTLEFCQWSVRQYADLQQMVGSTAFITPLSAGQAVEDWIMLTLGELIYYALPEFNPEHQTLSAIFKRFDIRATMRNVSIVPPGYPACGGRVIENGRLKWGNHRWGKLL